MKVTRIARMQIGKNGLTENFILSLKTVLETRENAKISVLKTATRNKSEVENISQQLCTALGKKFTCKIVGFTISIKKWRKIPASMRK